MMLHSAAFEHFVSSMEAQHAAQRPAGVPSERNRVVEEWVVVEDPLEPVHDVVQKLFEEPTRAGRKLAARRKRVIAGWGTAADGADTYYGKVCCANTVHDATTLYLRTKVSHRSAQHSADAILCALCDVQVDAEDELHCGVIPRRNDELVCRSCMSVYRLHRRTVPE